MYTMQKIIPLISLFGILLYLLHLPAPMDKIAKAVESREFYQLRIMDEVRQVNPLPLITPERKRDENADLVAQSSITANVIESLLINNSAKKYPDPE